MQTDFTLAQLADPDLAEANGILRTCVHCGFCNATCPTFVLLGDELDGPRGRIYLIKDMLERGADASAAVARHIDRCLSCLACMTTCPSGVHYMHLVDLARQRIEETYVRPLARAHAARAHRHGAAAPGAVPRGAPRRRRRAAAAAPVAGTARRDGARWCRRICPIPAWWSGRRSFPPQARGASAWRC